MVDEPEDAEPFDLAASDREQCRSDVIANIVVTMFGLAVFFGALYVMVRFVKWAWTD